MIHKGSSEHLLLGNTLSIIFKWFVDEIFPIKEIKKVWQKRDENLLQNTSQ